MLLEAVIIINYTIVNIRSMYNGASGYECGYKVSSVQTM